MKDIKDKLVGLFDGSHPIHELAHYHLQSGGKHIRAQLALCEGDRLAIDTKESGIWALSCELLHNATLIHDDIQDKDPLRRGQASLWKKYGIAQGINAGDYLIFRSFRLAASLKKPELVERLSTTAELLTEGQSLEFIKNPNPPINYWDDYLHLSFAKTGSLLLLPIWGVYILKGLPIPTPLKQAWLDLGVCYQIADDIRDYLGLKQLGQSKKDFQEKKLNALISWVAKKTEHSQLIEQYTHLPPESAAFHEALQRIDQVIHQEKIIQQLQDYSKMQINNFKKIVPQNTQSVIFQHLDNLPHKGGQNYEANI